MSSAAQTIRDITIAAGVVCLCAILIAHVATRPRYAFVAIPQFHQSDKVNALHEDNLIGVLVDTRDGRVAPAILLPTASPLFIQGWQEADAVRPMPAP